MLIGVEVEDKSEIFVYFRHIIVITSRCKDSLSICKGTIFFSHGKKLFAGREENRTFAAAKEREK